MRKLFNHSVSAILVSGLMLGMLSSCDTTSNEAWCKDFYELKPCSWEYDYCIENDGEPFSKPRIGA